MTEVAERTLPPASEVRLLWGIVGWGGVLDLFAAGCLCHLPSSPRSQFVDSASPVSILRRHFWDFASTIVYKR